MLQTTMKKAAWLMTGLLFSLNAYSKEKLFIPSHPQPKAALFVSMHGCLSAAEDSESSTRFSELAERYGFYVYYPEPAMGPDSKGCFEFYTEESQKPGFGDAAVIVNKVQELLQRYDIDSERVFVSGMSGGASLVSVLTSCYPDVFSGAVIHSGMGYGLASTWQQSLLIAQIGPNPFYQRNTTCSPGSFHGKMFLIQGSRDQVMNPRHHTALKKDYFGGLTEKKNWIPPQINKYGYTVSQFLDSNKQVRGKAVYVWGMNHEWSGADPINQINPRGPFVSQMIVDYFLGGQ